MGWGTLLAFVLVVAKVTYPCKPTSVLNHVFFFLYKLIERTKLVSWIITYHYYQRLNNNPVNLCPGNLTQLLKWHKLTTNEALNKT